MSKDRGGRSGFSQEVWASSRMAASSWIEERCDRALGLSRLVRPPVPAWFERQDLANQSNC